MIRTEGSRKLDSADLVKEDLLGILQHLEKASIAPTREPTERGSAGSFDDFLSYLGGEDAEAEGETAENAGLVSALEKANIQLQRELSAMEVEKRAVTAELDSYKEGHEKSNDEIQEQLQSCRTSTKNDVEHWKGLHDGLAVRVEALTDENGDLRTRHRQLEEEERRHREEGATARRSMEEATRLVAGMSEHLELLLAGQAAGAEEYEEELATLADELDRATASEEALAAALEALQGEHVVLRTQFEEAESYYENEVRIIKTHE